MICKLKKKASQLRNVCFSECYIRFNPSFDVSYTLLFLKHKHMRIIIFIFGFVSCIHLHAHPMKEVHNVRVE